MKKIIATVLAMVMAMALCVTAFAVNYSDGYYFANGKWNKIDLTKVSVSYTNPSETKTDGKVVSAKMRDEYPAFVRLYDLLFDGEEDLRALPWSERRARLEGRPARLIEDQRARVRAGS